MEWSKWTGYSVLVKNSFSYSSLSRSVPPVKFLGRKSGINLEIVKSYEAIFHILFSLYNVKTMLIEKQWEGGFFGSWVVIGFWASIVTFCD